MIRSRVQSLNLSCLETGCRAHVQSGYSSRLKWCAALRMNLLPGEKSHMYPTQEM